MTVIRVCLYLLLEFSRKLKTLGINPTTYLKCIMTKSL
jgi:hypothetical protein